MAVAKRRFSIVAACLFLVACSTTRFFKGGIYKELDDQLTIVKLTENPHKYLHKEVVFSVRYYKKGDLPCPLGDDYVNFVIADRVSYITLNKIWKKKEEASVLDSFKEMETVVMKAKVFKVDEGKDPNLLALEIIHE